MMPQEPQTPRLSGRLASGLTVVLFALSAGFGQDTMWGNWQGPLGCFSAASGGAPLLSKVLTLTPVWESADRIPRGRCSDGSESTQSGVSGGYSSPVYAHGRVYLYYYVPSGTVIDKNLGNNASLTYTGGATKEKWLIEADDVIHCFDAATGETLWKRTFARRGANMAVFNKSGPQLTPAVANGKVYAMGTGAHVYCVDAFTGDSLWETVDNKGVARRKEILDNSLRTQTLFAYNRDMLCNVACIGGVVIINDCFYYKDGKVDDNDYLYNSWVAYDGQTGATLWTKDQGSGVMSTASRWVSGGKEYAILSNDARLKDLQQPKTVCVDPTTGNVLWEITDVCMHRTAPVHGNEMVAARANAAGDYSLTCFTLSTTGATEKWALDAINSVCSSNLCVHDGYLYYERAHNELTAVSMATGRKVGALGGSYNFDENMSFVVATGDRVIYGGGRNGFLGLYGTAPDNFARIDAKNGYYLEIGYDCQLTPAIAGNKMYARLPDNLVCIDLVAPGAEVRQFAVLPPRQPSGVLRVLSIDGAVVGRTGRAPGVYLQIRSGTSLIGLTPVVHAGR